MLKKMIAWNDMDLCTGGVEIATAQNPHLRINCVRAQIKKFCTIAENRNSKKLGLQIGLRCYKLDYTVGSDMRPELLRIIRILIAGGSRTILICLVI